ncbi:MAG: stage V sporulation protein R [Gammaproteobacteria bacterium]|jgi:stage V sporulation protein R
MDATLRSHIAQLESLAVSQGLDYYSIDFETVPDSFMMEIAVYGLPIRMPHWSFGVRYIYQLVQHRMGNSRLFEVVFPGNPNRAYLASRNSVEENTLVAAHVIGHSDFAKNNSLFRNCQNQLGFRIVEQAAAHARSISDAIDTHGEARVEAVLDAALALEQHIDVHKGLTRPLYEADKVISAAPVDSEFANRLAKLDVGRDPCPDKIQDVKSTTPPAPERDLLWFIARYGSELEDWERDILLAVREESFYFYPVFACQIMNEGWACFWHARLLREASFLPPSVYLDAIKSHSDVVRPYAGESRVSASINPYYLGFKLWEHIIDNNDLEFAREVMTQDDDFSFVRNYLNEDIAEKLELFNYEVKSNGQVNVVDRDIDKLRENLLRPKYNFSAPLIEVRSLDVDGTLNLAHDFSRDGRGLDLARAEKVLAYVQKIWRRPITMSSTDAEGKEQTIEYPGGRQIH